MDREHLLDDPTGRQLGDCWETGMVTLGARPVPGRAMPLWLKPKSRLFACS